MGQLRYREGSVTVTLDGGLEAFVRAALDKVGGATIASMEKHAEAVAADARGAWYGPEGVERETGKAGEIEVVTTVDATRGEVRVSIGSTDTRVDKREASATSSGGTPTGKPLAVFQHRPKATSLVLVPVSKDEYMAAPKKMRRFNIKTGQHYVYKANPRAGDGKYLVAELVRKPARAVIKLISADIGAEVRRRAGG